MSLLSLPQELLEQICQEFCLHCQNAPSHQKSYFNVADQTMTPPEIKSLVALRSTCKVLAHIAQPHLYQRPVGKYFSGFVQMLSKYPELGHLVRHLSVARVLLPHGHLDGWMDGFLEYVPSFLESCYHMEGTALYEDARRCEFNPLPKSLVEQFDLPTLTTFDDEREALFITLGLSFMPNLVKLEIGLGNHWSFRWCRPDSLPCLRELVISEWSPPLIPNGGAIRGLLTAAPALERLELNQVTREIPESETFYLSHANLKDLVINASTLSSPNLRMIMNGFPNLQTFHLGWMLGMYWLGPDSETPCGSILTDVVLQRKDTLRYLSLDLSEADDMRGKKLQDLSGMAVLETLHIDRSMLTDEYDEGPHDQDISDILPPSIREFGLMGKADMWLYEEVLHMIIMRRENLQKVIVASEDLQKEEWSHWVNVFASACNKSNIEFFTQEPSHWTALTDYPDWRDDEEFEEP
ncbi:uncharacterized protein FIESC28_08736 [Fusarium coffeatum]|uniref:F-box domain-containing protein n=1 Tax=Fusarium coffeatum TaxID=231269 RepID=A0A366R7E1_9HYPO|nr:uncharacterized protein FIESC28_08736 [Fusarium coffeatum]RBR12250.1 hypothetical protein FIESC28_08736 [Fusarium coffeatum]